MHASVQKMPPKKKGRLLEQNPNGTTQAGGGGCLRLLFLRRQRLTNRTMHEQHA
jgi:hypothetical protein